MRSAHLFRVTAVIGAAALFTACADVTTPRTAADTPSAAIIGAGLTTVTVTAGGLSMTITDLGVPTGGTYSSGYTISNLGQIAGMASDATGALAPLLWTTGAATQIANFDPAGLLIPVRINNAGEMIMQENIGGTSIGYAIWRDAAGVQHRLPSHPGGDPLRVYGRGINASGIIVGVTREPSLGMIHGVLWQNGAFLQDIGAMAGYQSTNPQDINDLGVVVGASTSTTTFGSTAFRWQNGTFTNLGALSAGAASIAMAVNNTGTIVGTSNGGFPVRWVNGVIASLPVPAGVIQPTPVDVNDAGDIIGWGTASAVGSLYASALWRNGKAILLPSWPGTTQSMARSINNAGEIVGEGPIVPGGPMHALLWKYAGGTTPPPGTNTTPSVTLRATSATTINAGRTFSAQATITDPDNGPWRYTVNWGNGTTSGTRSSAGSFSVSRKYPAAGTYSVTLTATDATGAAGTSNPITVTVR